ncbi:MAG: ABC transporter permease, partial [Anaerolineae bacterium]
MFHRILTLIAKELIQFGRDRLLATFIILAPALQLLLMAQAIERGISEQPVVILDLDRSRLSRQLATNLDTSEELAVRYHVDNPDDMRRLLDRGQARMAVIIPAGFSEQAAPGGSTQYIQIVADATNTMAASVVMGAASDVVNGFSADLAANSG